VSALSSGEQDREAVVQRAVQQVASLLSAHTVELVLHVPEPLLVRQSASGEVWSGRPADAVPVTGQVAEVRAIGDAEGELRVFLGDGDGDGDGTLSDRETAALGILAAAASTALRNARAHAELAAMAEQAAYAASHDSTTGLPKRQLLLSWVGDHLAWCRAGGEDAPVALACLFITGFGEILDACGAEVADQLLVHATTQLAAGTGRGEQLAHVGGDTFAIWFPDAIDVEHVRDRAAQLLAVLAAPAPLESGPVVLSGVAGLVYAPPSTVGAPEQLLRQARVALRQAHRRKLPVAIYRAEDDTRGQAAIVLRSELRTALRRGDLELHYQPVLDLATGRPVAVEALPRWRHPARGLLEPSVWMPVLEQSDLVGRYVQWLLSRGLRAHHAWHRQGVTAPVAVNLPGTALLDPGLPATVAAALRRADTQPGQLTLELTESRALAEADIVDQVLADLGRLGVGVAVDDFGTAGTSLARLRRVPVSEIKLAAELTADLLVDQETRAIVEAIVAFASRLDVRVTAQNVPTLEHVAALVSLRVHAGQGPRLCPPVHADSIVEALQVAAEHAIAVRDAKVINFPTREG